MLILLVADFVEDEEFGFRPDETRIGNAGSLEERLRLARNVSRIARELFRLIGSTMLAMTLTVGRAKNGSRRVVVASGTAIMSDS
jgi:hypothetical protein